MEYHYEISSGISKQQLTEDGDCKIQSTPGVSRWDKETRSCSNNSTSFVLYRTYTGHRKTKQTPYTLNPSQPKEARRHSDKGIPSFAESHNHRNNAIVRSIRLTISPMTHFVVGKGFFYSPVEVCGVLAQQGTACKPLRACQNSFSVCGSKDELAQAAFRFERLAARARESEE